MRRSYSQETDVSGRRRHNNSGLPGGSQINVTTVFSDDSKRPQKGRHTKAKRHYGVNRHYLSQAEYHEYLYWCDSVYSGLTKVDFRAARSCGVTRDRYARFIKGCKKNGRLLPIKYLCDRHADWGLLFAEKDANGKQLSGGECLFNTIRSGLRLYLTAFKWDWAGKKIDKSLVKV